MSKWEWMNEVNGWVNDKVKQCVHGRVSELCKVCYGLVCKLRLEFVLDVREGPMYIVFYLNITRQLHFEYLFYALYHLHHSRRPGTIWLPVGLSDWLLWSYQSDCLSHLYICRVIRLTAMKLSCWLPYSWANQCCPVHMTHHSTMTTTAPVLRNRSWEWFSQQASGPLRNQQQFINKNKDYATWVPMDTSSKWPVRQVNPLTPV